MLYFGQSIHISLCVQSHAANRYTQGGYHNPIFRKPGEAVDRSLLGIVDLEGLGGRPVLQYRTLGSYRSAPTSNILSR